MEHRVHISKRISQTLRHLPERLPSGVDERGFGSIAELAEFLNLPVEEVRELVSGEGRMEVVGDKVRAKYGHSAPVRLREAAPDTVPAVLYHSTPEENWGSIAVEGLLPLKRQYVHLGTTPAAAARNAQHHRASRNVLLAVDAASMMADGAKFWVGSEAVWLSEAVAPKFLTLMSS